MIKDGASYGKPMFIEFENDQISHYEISEKSENATLEKNLIYSEKFSETKNEFVNENRIRLYRMGKTHTVISETESKTEDTEFLPILAEYKLNHRFSLGIGPVFGYSINRKVEYDNNSFNEFMDNNNTSEKFELNLGIDFGYSLNNIGLFIRYNHGIKERQNLKTSLFQLGLNYKL